MKKKTNRPTPNLSSSKNEKKNQTRSEPNN